MTMNDTWGYKKNDHNWKPVDELLHNLIDIASKGGNYLLNVGPTSEGLIPEPSVERLAEISKWMKVNGEAIYGTTATPFTRPLAWGRCTKKVDDKGVTLYLHVFNWPADGRLTLPAVRNFKKAAYLLADAEKKPLAISSSLSTRGGMVISLPEKAPDPISSTVVLRVKSTLDINQPPALPDPQPKKPAKKPAAKKPQA